MDGIGPRTVEQIIRQFQGKELISIINDLKAAGLQFAAPAAAAGSEAAEQIFAGQSWCVTGSFDNFKPRDLATEEVKKRGGRIVTGVSSKTTHLLAGENAGSKLDKAESLGVAVVSEAEFMKLIV